MIKILKTITKILAENVRSLRKAKKLSQNALAERAELSFRGIQEIEYENAWPELATIEALAKALEVSPSRLFRDPDLDSSPSPFITVDHALYVLREYVEATKKKTLG